MREVTFRHLNSIESRKKDIFLKEVFERDGVQAKTERRCFYFIRGVTHLSEENDLQKWIDSQCSKDPMGKRHFYILKEHNDGLGKDRLICKIAGTFYAVVDKAIFTIGFLHSFKVSFSKNACSK